MKRIQPISWQPIIAVVGTIEVKGEYSLDKDDFMTVRMHGGKSKSARGGPAAESVARIMLGELFREAGQ